MKRILVANRGEIALRIMRSVKEMGIETVAIYSDADIDAPHVKFADFAIHIGPSPSNQSYLLGDKIIELSKKMNVDGIHPGFGFLSENAAFAQAVTNAGITFIGPSPEAMELMGNKLKAKETVSHYNIPMVPGTDHAISDIPAAKDIALEIGYPILIKAAAGGGGKGMRIVEDPKDFEEQMDRAISEAVSSFGDGAVFIERYVQSPRHIEIQVLSDTHGNYVHLNDRECSIQRRHQKVIEEAPSPVITPEKRAEMGACAINVAKSCDYVGAGTVEFIFDENGDFFFLEMNTRLQVEHSVTEQITHIDLVKEQIKVARGEKLDFTQEDVKIIGHSIEVRVYAEDAENGFLPDTGKLEVYKRPQGPGVRVDDGLEEGMEIPIYYDPMIAKLITHGMNREDAINKMTRAINEYEIVGVKTTLPFGAYVMKHEAFRTGNFDTHFVTKHFKPEDLQNENEEEALIAALIAATNFTETREVKMAYSSENQQYSNWQRNRRKLR